MQQFLKNNVSYVTFEMSNICNNATVHPKCPAHYAKSKVILSCGVISDVIKFLSENEYHGWIGFNVYNEPMIDPRLYYLMDKIRKCMNDNVILVLWTNGYFINQTIIDELWRLFGINRVYISAYNDSEYERLEKLLFPVEMYYEIKRRFLDDRLNFYIQKENNCESPCFAPLSQLVIGCDGSIVLCCLDYEKRYTFGNLYNQKIEDVLLNEKMLETKNELETGIRSREICRRCGWSIRHVAM